MLIALHQHACEKCSAVEQTVSSLQPDFLHICGIYTPYSEKNEGSEWQEVGKQCWACHSPKLLLSNVIRLTVLLGISLVHSKKKQQILPALQ